jgi:hypothetical protein
MIPGGWRCNKRVGFLFPHLCERSSPEGCPDCDNGRVMDPYRSRTDRLSYSTDYDTDAFSFSELHSASHVPAFGGGDSGGGGASMDFSEADGATLENSDEAFEDDSSAS